MLNLSYKPFALLYNKKEVDYITNLLYFNVIHENSIYSGLNVYNNFPDVLTLSLTKPIFSLIAGSNRILCAADLADSSKHLFPTPVLSMQSSTLTVHQIKLLLKPHI